MNSKPRWTADNIPDLRGKVAIVSGANSGIGFETAHQLVKHGCKVIMACRNLQKGEEARQEIIDKLPGTADLLVLAHLDLASFASIREFADSVCKNYKDTGIHILINNAGVLDVPFQHTEDGFDMTFQVNYLGHFLLTSLLYPLLQMNADARIVQVGSSHHRYGIMDFNEIEDEMNEDLRARYYNSKLMILSFCMELDRRIKAANHNVISVAAHPGFAATEILTKDTNKKQSCFAGIQRSLFFPMINRIVGQSPADGALPSLFAATAPGVTGGKYYGPDGFMEWSGNVHETSACDAAYDKEDAKELWETSEAYIQKKFFEVEEKPAAERRLSF